MKWKFLSAFFFAVFLFVQLQAQGNNRGNAYYEEMIGNLSNQLRLLQDENAKLSGTVHSLQQELRELRQQPSIASGHPGSCEAPAEQAPGGRNPGEIQYPPPQTGRRALHLLPGSAGETPAGRE